MRTSQSFPFYHADFLLGTALMSCEQVGAYIRLLCHQWEQGSLPKDENLLAKLAQTSSENIHAVLHKFQTVSGDRIKNRKLEEVRKSLNAYRKSRSDNGKKGGRPRKHMVSGCFQDAKAYEKPPSPSPIPSPSPSPNTPKPPPADADFETFWLAYPKRRNRGDAIKAWKKAITKTSTQNILDSVAAHKTSPDWTKDAGKFIPHPASWLNAEGWANEINGHATTRYQTLS